MGVLSYLGILVFVPLIAGNKQSPYVRFHTNQGLVLFIASVIVELLDGRWIWGFHSMINFGGSWFSWIFEMCIRDRCLPLQQMAEIYRRLY